jgi:hypothetical protein
MSDRTPLDAENVVKHAVRNWLRCKGWPEWFSSQQGKRVNIDEIILAHADEFGATLRAEVSSLESQRAEAGICRHNDSVKIANLESRLAAIISAEHELSDAYIRIRQILDAFQTPFAPTEREVWNHTESKARELVTRAESLEVRLQAVTEAHRWIPVEEKLPEPGTLVLVHTTSGHIDTDAVNRHDGLWECDDDWTVSHWTTLPAPPTEPSKETK